MEGRERFERIVKELEAVGHRGSATPNEERAVDYICTELGAIGIRARKEAFWGSDALGARILVHLGVAAVGLLLLHVSPLITILTGLLVSISFYGDMNTRFTWLGRLLPVRISHNAVGRIPAVGGDSPKHRIILCAHIDTQRTGLMWKGRLVKPLARLFGHAKGPMKSPMFLVVLAFGLQMLTGWVELIWPGSFLACGLFGFIAFVYVVGGFVVAEWAWGRFVPGACDNATGAAAVIELAERWQAKPVEGVEVVTLLCGCEETGALGAAAWLDAHRAELANCPNYFFAIDSLGYGGPRFVGAEHSLATNAFHYPRDLVDVCAKVAFRRKLDRPGPCTFPTFSDGLAFMNRGIPGVLIMSFEDDMFMPNYHQMGDTSANMSFDIAWDCVEYGWEVLCELAAHVRMGRKPSSY